MDRRRGPMGSIDTQNDSCVIVIPMPPGTVLGEEQVIVYPTAGEDFYSVAPSTFATIGDVVGVIYNYLTLLEVIQVSATCRTWREEALQPGPAVVDPRSQSSYHKADLAQLLLGRDILKRIEPLQKEIDSDSIALPGAILIVICCILIVGVGFWVVLEQEERFFAQLLCTIFPGYYHGVSVAAGLTFVTSVDSKPSPLVAWLRCALCVVSLVLSYATLLGAVWGVPPQCGECQGACQLVLCGLGLLSLLLYALGVLLWPIFLRRRWHATVRGDLNVLKAELHRCKELRNEVIPRKKVQAVTWAAQKRTRRQRFASQLVAVRPWKRRQLEFP